jgi:hypothetical protein
MIRPERRIGLWAAATLWLIAHAVFHLWEVAVGICSPSVIPRDRPAVTCWRSSGRCLPSGQSITRAPREPHPPEIRQEFPRHVTSARTNLSWALRSARACGVGRPHRAARGATRFRARKRRPRGQDDRIGGGKRCQRLSWMVKLVVVSATAGSPGAWR